MIHLEKIDYNIIHLIRKWRNHDRVFFHDKNLITHNQQEEWYKKYLKDNTEWRFVIYYNDIPIGTIGFSILPNSEAHIETVILGEKEYDRKGYMSEALRQLMLMFPFKKFSLEVQKTNIIAVTFYKKNGFAIAFEKDDCYIMTK